MVSMLNKMPTPEGVMVRVTWNQLDDDRRFKPGSQHESSAQPVRNELEKWAKALRAMP